VNGDTRKFRFGAFEADASSGELRKFGTRLRIQEQPFQVLLTLIQRPGEVISREDLRRQLWPSDTFVDFDHSLNTIINKLREILGDSATNPRFIETLAKRGYRFLAPVEVHGNGQPTPSQLLPAMERPDVSPAILTDPAELPSSHRGTVRVLFVLIQIMYLCFYIAALYRLSAVEDLIEQVFGHHELTVVLIISAVVGIPIRFYLLTAAAFDVKDLARKFIKLFPAVLILDELWALAPFLLAMQLGTGLALGITAALVYVPFAQRTLALMAGRKAEA
jgi:DNA-binding winged helix-turn-helix (wHTH) protein